MTNLSPIGVFDSGVGGLTSVRELTKLLPHEDIIYLGDTARMPYGTKSQQTISKYVSQDIKFLEQFGVKMIIAACGTASSVFPTQDFFKNIDICAYTGVIDPTIKAACQQTQNKRIGIIATAASIRSGMYQNEIKKIIPDAEVVAKACPLFVPLVENGYAKLGNKVTQLVVEEYLSDIKQKQVDTLILGCTHFPLLAPMIQNYLGEGVKLISSGAEAAKFAKNILEQKNMLNPTKESGKLKLFCTDSVELFKENVDTFLEHNLNTEILQTSL